MRPNLSHMGLIAITLLLVFGSALAEVPQHPFALKSEAVGLDLSFGRLQWGKTTLSYSQTWLGGQSLSQARFLKDLRAPLADGLEFNASFGLAYTPGSGLNPAGETAELVIPYAALHWQPSENFQLRLEYSQPGLGGYPYYGSRGGYYGNSPGWPVRSFGQDEASTEEP